MEKRLQQLYYIKMKISYDLGFITTDKSKDMEKRLQQLYYIKMKISYDLGFITTESLWQRYDAITFFIYLCISLY